MVVSAAPRGLNFVLLIETGVGTDQHGQVTIFNLARFHFEFQWSIE
jgi:hypothetical protein